MDRKSDIQALDGQSELQKAKRFSVLDVKLAGLSLKSKSTEFKVSGFEGILYLRAKTESEMKTWITIIRGCAKQVGHVSSFQNLLLSLDGLWSNPMESSISHSLKNHTTSISEIERKDLEFVSLAELLDKLTSVKIDEQSIGGGKWQAFLIYMHICYATFEDVSKMLFKSLEKPPEKFLQHKAQYQGRIISLFCNWLDEIPRDFETIDIEALIAKKQHIDKTCETRFTELVTRIQQCLKSESVVEPLDTQPFTHDDNSLLGIIGRAKSRSVADGSDKSRADGSPVRPSRMRRTRTFTEKKLGVFLRKFAPTMDISKIEPEELSVQLLHIDLDYIKSITPRSLMKKLWKKKNAGELCPDLMHAISTWNKRCYWIATVILSDNTKTRKKSNSTFFKHVKMMLKRFILIACHCVEMGNYFCASCVVCALKLQCVRRLRPAWEMLSKESKKQYQQIQQACDRKFYWKLFEKSQSEEGIHLPHLAIILDALYQIEIKACKDSENQINMPKYRKQWDIIYRVMHTQRCEVTVGKKNDELASALTACIHWSLSEERLYAISYKNYPKKG